MSEDDEFAAQVRAHLIEAFGPEVMHDALYSEEAKSYFAARREVDAREAAYLAAAKDGAREIANRLSECLPDGLRFEWTEGDRSAGALEVPYSFPGVALRLEGFLCRSSPRLSLGFP